MFRTWYAEDENALYETCLALALEETRKTIVIPPKPAELGKDGEVLIEEEKEKTIELGIWAEGSIRVGEV